MKKVDSAVHDRGVGGGWFKLWDFGHVDATDEWGTERLIRDKGESSASLSSSMF